jgi:hypothetical protein
MSVVTTCDHCKQTIRDVAYLLTAVHADNPDPLHTVTGPAHLHWDCIPLFDRDKTRAEPS